MPKKVTIKDIADAAGVSTALVSFVMNNRTDDNGKEKYRVGEETRKKVLKVAEELNYQPSANARNLRMGRSGVVGVILPDLANMFYGTIARELDKVLEEHGYMPILGSSDEDPAKFDKLFRTFMGREVEGFIVVPTTGSRKSMDSLVRSGIPFVVMDRHSDGLVVPTVLSDNAAATRQLVDVLRTAGAKRLAMVSYEMRISSMIDREDAFIACGHSREDIYLMPFDGVEAAADSIADKILSKGYDGVIGTSNIPSVALTKALYHRGVRLQEDFHVAGFDFPPLYEPIYPKIPYMMQQLPELSRAAAGYLLRIMAAGEGWQSGPEFKVTITLPFLLK